MRATFRSVVELANRLQRSACSRRVCASLMTAPSPTHSHILNSVSGKCVPSGIRHRSASKAENRSRPLCLPANICLVRGKQIRNVMSHYEHCPVRGDLRYSSLHLPTAASGTSSTSCDVRFYAAVGGQADIGHVRSALGDLVHAGQDSRLRGGGSCSESCIRLNG